MKAGDHKNLRAFDLAKKLNHKIYAITSIFPQDQKYVLTTQLQRSALSVPSNIVEGFARPTIADRVHFLYMAYASLREAEYQIEFACERQYIGKQAHLNISVMIKETSRVLGSLITSLENKK